MNEEIFAPMIKVLRGRRPTWQYLIEDTLIRVSTMYFAVNWQIIDEVLEAGDYEVEEVIMHSALGQVICIRYKGGK